jgi:hypothetical protein
MKTIETKGRQYIEVWDSRKEALKDVIDILESANNNCWDSDCTLFISYNDGTCFFIDDFGDREGKFKKTGIATIIYSNACTTAVFGDYEIYNIDDIDEKYSPEKDSEDKIWNVA